MTFDFYRDLSQAPDTGHVSAPFSPNHPPINTPYNIYIWERPAGGAAERPDGSGADGERDRGRPAGCGGGGRRRCVSVARAAVLPTLGGDHPVRDD